MLSNYQELIEKNPVSLATITPEGRPNIIVVAEARLIEENKILITDNYMHQTLIDIAHCSQVCLSAFDVDWQGVKIIGKVSYHTCGDYLTAVKSMPENDGHPAKGALVVEVEQVIGLK